MLVSCLVFVVVCGLLVLPFVKFVMDFEFMAMMRLWFFELCCGLRLGRLFFFRCSDLTLLVLMCSTFVFCIHVLVVVEYVFVSLDSVF